MESTGQMKSVRFTDVDMEFHLFSSNCICTLHIKPYALGAEKKIPGKNVKLRLDRIEVGFWRTHAMQIEIQRKGDIFYWNSFKWTWNGENGVS